MVFRRELEHMHIKNELPTVELVSLNLVSPLMAVDATADDVMDMPSAGL